MKQNEHLSIAVTKGIVVAIALACVAMCLRGPATVRWLVAYRHLNITGPAVAPALLALGYLCAALAFSMLYNLYRFLGRLGQGALFVPQNVTAHQPLLRGRGGALPAHRSYRVCALCVSGCGGWVHGAHRAGHPDRLCTGRPHEKRTGPDHLRGRTWRSL